MGRNLGEAAWEFGDISDWRAANSVQGDLMQVSFSILRANGEVGKVYTADGDVIAFGRFDDCDVQLDDNYVSGRHAEIRCIDGRFYLQDLKSTNGTWVKEDRINDRIQIRDNAIIEFGKGGPKVRVVSLLGQSAGAVVIPPMETDKAKGSHLLESANSASTAKSVPKSSSTAYWRLSFIAAGCVAAVGGVIFLMPSGTNSVQPQSVPLPGSESGSTHLPDDVSTPSNALEVPLPEIDFAKIAESVRDQSVWIGLKMQNDDQDTIYPLCSGWSHSSSHVITTGKVVADLLSDGQSSTIVVYSHRLPESAPFVEVKRMTIHPGFNVSDPGSSASKESNLGMLELAEPLPPSVTQQHEVAGIEEWRASLTGNSTASLVQCGYSIPPELEPISPLTMPTYSWGNIARTESIPGSSVQVLPLIRVLVQKAQSTTSGHVVLNSDGKIIGTLLQIGETNAVLIPIDRIPQLISSVASRKP